MRKIKRTIGGAVNVISRERMNDVQGLWLALDEAHERIELLETILARELKIEPCQVCGTWMRDRERIRVPDSGIFCRTCIILALHDENDARNLYQDTPNETELRPAVANALAAAANRGKLSWAILDHKTRELAKRLAQ